MTDENDKPINRESIGDPSQHRVRISLFIEEVHNGFVVKEAETPKGITLVAKNHEEVIRLVGNYVKDEMNAKLTRNVAVKPKDKLKVTTQYKG